MWNLEKKDTDELKFMVTKRERSGDELGVWG